MYLFVFFNVKKPYVQLPGSIYCKYTLKFKLQAVLLTCQSCKVDREENYFLLYNLTSLQPMLEFFFHVRMMFHMTSLGNISADIRKIVDLRHEFYIAIC